MRIRHRVIVALLLLITGARILAQPPNEQVAFEVAAVKADPDARMFRFSFLPGNQLIIAGVPLSVLISRAYNLQPFELSGLPAWANSERYAITAKGPEALASSSGQTLAMLRALLADRFKLRAHRETKDGPTYALTMDRADRTLGPRLLPPTEDCSDFILGTSGTGGPRCNIEVSREGVYTFRGRTLARFATDIQRFVGRPIVDRTRLTERFDIELQFAPEGPSDGPRPPADAATNIYTAVREQLGLRLESSRGPVSVLVVDSVERPTPD